MTAQWKESLLPRLEGFDLFPFGGGADGKAPIGGTNWQHRPETVAQIAARNGSCIALGVYPSQGAGFECFDIDGKSAYEYLTNTLGIDPDAAVKAGAWKIYRPSDPYRFKLIFRVEQPEAIPHGKPKIITQEPNKDEEKKQEAIEWFYGAQGCIIAGLHKQSGDYYGWENGPNGGGVNDLTVTPLEWRKARSIIQAQGSQKKAKAIKTNGSEWTDARAIFGKCPSCGRDSDDNCRATVDGTALQCHHGSTFSPDLEASPGLRLQAGNNILVLRNHTNENAIGRCSLFTLETAEDLFAEDDAAIKLEKIEQFRKSLNSELDLDDIFNAEIATLLTSRAASLPCDPIAYVMPLLATAASVVGKRCKFIIKGGEDTWSEPCVIWGGNVMPPSSLKSPIARDIIKPVEKLQRESIERCKKQDDDDDSEELKPRRFSFNGITHAAMVDLICEEKTIGLIGYYDELASLFADLERSHNIAMRAELLSLWTGGPISRDTKMHGHVYAANTAVSLFGNIQPDKLRALVTKDGAADNAGDGLWCRFLWCRPKDHIWQYNEIVANIQEKLSDIVEALDRIASSTFLKLSPAAINTGARQWNEWELEKRDVDAAEAAFIGKLRGYSVRLAGVLHLLDLATAQADPFASGLLDLGDHLIPAQAMERALLLCRFCLGQWQQLQSELGHGAIPANVAALLAKAAAAGMTVVTPRDLVRWKLLGRNTKAAEAAAFLQDVADTWHYGTIQRGQRGSICWVPPA